MDSEILTEKDKAFIVANYATMSVLQMAIRLDKKIENRKCPLIEDFIQRANLVSSIQEKPSQTVVVQPPATIQQEAEKIIEKPVAVEPADEAAGPESCTIDEFVTYLKEIGLVIHVPLGERQKRELNFLLSQLSGTRFALMFKSFRTKDYKSLFKEEFVKGMFGKGEMPPEEVNDFLDLANEAVTQHDLKCKIKDLEIRKASKETTIPQKLVFEQLISDMNKQYGESVKRAGDIKKTLGAHREQRLKDNRAIGLTVAMLLEAVYDSEKREELLKLQKKTDDKLHKIISQLDDMQEVKATIMGISPEELENGAL